MARVALQGAVSNHPFQITINSLPASNALLHSGTQAKHKDLSSGVPSSRTNLNREKYVAHRFSSESHIRINKSQARRDGNFFFASGQEEEITYQETTKDPKVEGSRSYQSSVTLSSGVQKLPKHLFSCVSVQSERGDDP